MRTPEEIPHGLNFKDALLNKVNEICRYLHASRVRGDNQTVFSHETPSGILFSAKSRPSLSADGAGSENVALHEFMSRLVQNKETGKWALEIYNGFDMESETAGYLYYHSNPVKACPRAIVQIPDPLPDQKDPIVAGLYMIISLKNPSEPFPSIHDFWDYGTYPENFSVEYRFLSASESVVPGYVRVSDHTTLYQLATVYIHPDGSVRLYDWTADGVKREFSRTFLRSTFELYVTRDPDDPSKGILKLTGGELDGVQVPDTMIPVTTDSDLDLGVVIQFDEHGNGTAKVITKSFSVKRNYIVYSPQFYGVRYYRIGYVRYGIAYLDASTPESNDYGAPPPATAEFSTLLMFHYRVDETETEYKVQEDFYGVRLRQGSWKISLDKKLVFPETVFSFENLAAGEADSVYCAVAYHENGQLQEVYPDDWDGKRYGYSAIITNNADDFTKLGRYYEQIWFYANRMEDGIYNVSCSSDFEYSIPGRWI